MVKFHLITGFLGSGKTTFLKNILSQLSAHKRVAVIQNEFAPTGIDGKELQQNNNDFKLIEINNGSVFCVCQLNTFVTNLDSLIQEYEPEEIFLEASGMADPISIADLLQTSNLKNKVQLGRIISLVDAVNFKRGLACLTRFKHQIMIADEVILNKCDLVNDTESIVNEIRQLNPFASINETSYAKYDWKAREEHVNDQHVAAKQFLGCQSDDAPEIKASVLRCHDKLPEITLRAFISSIQKESVRMKGFLNLDHGEIVSIHAVFDQLTIEKLENYSGPTELIVFSETLSMIDIRKRLKQFRKQKVCCTNLNT